MNSGPLLMVVATLVLTANSAMVKMARVELGVLDIVVWRSVVAIPFAWWFVRSASLHVQKKAVFALRVTLGFAAMLCFFTALKGLALADTNLITKLQPVLIALGAPVFLGRAERPQARTWMFLALGLVGTFILIAPKLSTGNIWGLWALAASVLSAGAHIALRGLKDENAGAIVFWMQIAVCSAAIFLSLAQDGSLTVPSSAMWPPLVGVGVFTAAGQLLITKAYSLDTASRVAAVRFIGPVWGIAFDVLFFGGWPSVHVWVGGFIVVSAGLAVSLRSKT
jgi:drug/metabolite transporter (DMT)-like permease